MATPLAEFHKRGKASQEVVSVLDSFDRLLGHAIEKAQSVYDNEVGVDLYRGLYINEREVDRLLARTPGSPLMSTAKTSDGSSLHRDFFDNIELTPILALLGEMFSLTLFDLAIIVLAFSVEVDLRYERLFAYLQDDITRRRPSVDLALNLLCTSIGEKLSRRSHFAPESQLIKSQLLRLISDPTRFPPSLLTQHLKLDDQITHLLLGQRVSDAALAPFCELIHPSFRIDELPVSSDLKRALPFLVRRASAAGQSLRLGFSGPNVSEKLQVAQALAGEIEAPLLIADLGEAVRDDSDHQILKRIFREALFHGAILYLDGCDRLLMERREFRERALMEVLSAHNGIVIAACLSTPTFSAVSAGTLEFFTVPFPIPSFELRRECWRTSASERGVALAESELDNLAGLFRLTPRQISEAVGQARNKALWRAGLNGNTAPTRPTLSDLSAAARAQSGQILAQLARKIEPVYQWSDIVLPDETLTQLRELCQRVQQRHVVMNSWGFSRKLSLGKGVSALFAGPSGTGKTMAAEVIARELGLDLYKIDLSSVVSKYIGETEKNLDRIFSAAENSNAIVFIDECDSLMGKRSEVRDAHDRYANIEIAYLLQKMEEYEGVVILATNLRQNLDESFLRRLAFTIHFPFPDDDQRRQIWGGVWPEHVPRAENLDLGLLALQFKLSGGNIKNIALAAAFLAAADGGVVTMSHLVRATRREYQKLGKPLGTLELGGLANQLGT